MLPRVLVVDDEMELGHVLSDLLELEGCEVAVCSDIASARDKLAGDKFDVAMLDVYLSESPIGLDLARHILDECPDTSVILMTGYADEAEVDAACLNGAYTCIAKPFSLEDVVKVVGMALERGSAERNSVSAGSG